MALAARQTSTTPARRWRNELPAWILADPAWVDLAAGPRATLQAIADRADAADPAGHLLNCFGGRGLIAAAGASRATFFRHVKVLEARGFVICTARGFKSAGRDVGNVYAVPGCRGGLDHRKVHRRMQRMVHAGGGVYVPQFFDPHHTPELFAGVSTSAGQPGPAPVNPADPQVGGSVNLTLAPVSKRDGPPSQSDTSASVKLTLHHPPHPSQGPVARAREGGGGAGPVSACDQVNAQLTELCRWLDRIGWRIKAPPARRVLLIRRDPAHALAAWSEFRRRAAAIEVCGRRVKSPAALFDTCFTGGGKPTANISKNITSPLEQLRALRDAERRAGR